MTTYYLDNSVPVASDSNAGTSPDAPFRTLAALNNRIFEAGDDILIKAGTTHTGQLTIHDDGTSTVPITFTRYGTGADPVIQANGARGIHLQDAHYVIIDSITVTNASRAGVALDASSSHNRLLNMEVSRSGFGFELAGADNNLFRGNYVHELRMVHNTPGGDDDYGAVAFVIEGKWNVFEHNKVWNAKAPSYDYGYDGGGFEFWRSGEGNWIHHNTVQDSDGFVEVGGLGASDVLKNTNISYNVSEDNGRFAYLHDEPSHEKYGLTVTDFQMYSNAIL